MIRMMIRLPGPLVWTPGRKSRRPARSSFPAVKVLLAGILALAGAQLAMRHWFVLGSVLLLAAGVAMMIHGIRRRNR